MFATSPRQRIGQINGIIAESGKVGEFVARRFVGSFGGHGGRRPGKRRRKAQCGVDFRFPNAMQTLGSHRHRYTSPTRTRDRIRRSRISLGDVAAPVRWLEPARASPYRAVADRTWVGEGGDDLHTTTTLRSASNRCERRAPVRVAQERIGGRLTLPGMSAATVRSSASACGPGTMAARAVPLEPSAELLQAALEQTKGPRQNGLRLIE